MDIAIMGQRIKLLRSGLKLNQTTFAESIGITQSTLSSYENGNVVPSTDVLLTIAIKYHISLDWLFGLSTEKSNISTMGDVATILFQLDEIKELRFELEINDHLPNDMEDDKNRWYTAIKFYGNDKEHTGNADMCELLSSFEENRNGFESYFTSKEMYDIWKREKIDTYSQISLNKKVYPKLDSMTRTKLRNEYLEKQFKNNEK